jgi:hypothetical protein
MAAKSADPDSGGNTIFASSASETDVEVNGAPAGDEPNKQEAFQKRLTLTFKNVSVQVAAPGEALGETLWSRANPGKLLSLFRRTETPKMVSMDTLSLHMYLLLLDLKD